MVEVELGEAYAKCCKETKNWLVEYGEVVCTKCGRVLEDDVVALIAIA